MSNRVAGFVVPLLQPLVPTSPIQRSVKILVIGLVGFVCLVSGCAPRKIVRLGEGTLPETLRYEEEGVLEEVRQEVARLEEKGALYGDPALENYLNETGQKMIPAGRASSGVSYRFRIVRDPTLNAFAYPTGDIFVHTGLLSRLRSEGELADVLGHESSHVYSRDTLYRLISGRRKVIAWKITDLVLTPVATAFGVGGATELGLSVIYATAITGYGREQEARADTDGLEQLIAAGYDPYEGIRAEERFLAEKEKYQKGPEIFFLSSHPNTQWRKEAKERWLKERGIQARPSKARDERYMAVTTEARKENARLNLQMRRYHHALDDLEPILLKEGADAAQAWVLKGEAYRQMAENPWAVKDELNLNSAAWRALKGLKKEEQVERWHKEAQEAYTQAIRLDPEGPEGYRGLGLLLDAQEDFPEAISHLERYLVLAPEAGDRRFVTHQIDRVKKKLREEEARKEASH